MFTVHRLYCPDCGKACNSGAEGFDAKIRWLLKQAFGYRDREYLRLKIYALPDTQTNREL